MPTQILSIPLASSGPGPSVDVSAMVGPKTVQLTGTFRGAYVVYGSHDGTHFAPLFQFDAGGVEGFRRTFSGALARVLISSFASGASGVTASISGVVTGLGGDNSFATLGVLPPGTRGPQPALDLGLVNFVSDLNFIAQGGISGNVVVEGSLDGVRWNPIGEFSVDSSGSSLLAPAPVEFGPLATDAEVRYVRLDVLGEVTSTLTVTVGGSKGSSGGVGLPETLAQAYQAGSAPVDQTLVLRDDRGGSLVIDAQGIGGSFTGTSALQVLVPAGISNNVGLLAFWSGGLELGPDNVLIGQVGYPATVSAGATGGVAIGGGSGCNSLSTGVGCGTGASGIISLALGYNAQASGDLSIAVLEATAQGYAAIAMGENCHAYKDYDVVLGAGSYSPYAAGNGHNVMVGDSIYGGGITAGATLVGSGILASGDYPVVCGYGAKAFDSLTTGGAVVLGGGAQGDSGTVVAGFGALATATGANPSCYSVVLGRGAAGYGETSAGLVVIGQGAVAGGVATPLNGCVVIGSGASCLGDSDVVIGLNAQPVGADTFRIAVGREAHPSGSDGIAVGFQATNTPLTGNGQAISVGRASSSCDGGISLGFSAQSGSVDTVLVGRNTTASASSDGSVVVGAGASGDGLGLVVVGESASVLSGAHFSVVAGGGAKSSGLESVVVGHFALAGSGSFNVVVGSLSVMGGVGAGNTLVGSFAYVGDPSGETRDFHNNVRLGGGNGMYSNYSVAVGNNTVVGDTTNASAIEYCVAVGSWSTVTGSYGMAFGLNATAAAHEVVFGDGVFNDGYVEKFHVVADVPVSMYGQTFSSAADSVYAPGVATTLTSGGVLPAGLLDRQVVTISGSALYDGNWYVSHVDRVANKFDISTAFAGDDSGNWANVEYADLFSADMARLTGPNTTVMTLVIKRSDGTTVLNVPVTLSAPALGVSNLQVANS